jgi:hypothetical protein
VVLPVFSRARSAKGFDMTACWSRFLAYVGFALATGLVALVTTCSAGHAHDFWINHGMYTSPQGVHCCGQNDCHEVPGDEVRAGPAGYMLILDGDRIETVPYQEAQPSEDGKYWRCQRYDGSRRCFFAPQPGS